MLQKLLFFALLGLSFMIPSPASGQQVPGTGWQVSCVRGDCNMNYTISNDQGIVTNLNIYMVGGVPVLEYLIPLGVGVERGVILQIDGQQAFRTQLLVCRPNGCSGFVRLESDLLTRLQRGGVLRVAFQNFADRQLYSFNFSLIGFSSRYTAFQLGSAG
ncbi:MAG: invasion associated locus B family protein [Pseudomonadota bacterium]